MFEPKRGPSGELLQSATPKKAKGESSIASTGLLVRGVVVSTFVEAIDDGTEQTQSGVYCSVLLHTCLPGMKTGYLPRCVVAQRAGMHDGEIWRPRSASIEIGSGIVDVTKFSDPAKLDGDHVLVGFLDQSYSLPVVLGTVPHPSVDAGDDTSLTNIDKIGQRLQPRPGDENVRMWRHHGAYFGVDGQGNFVLDTTRAHNGTYEANGKEPDRAPGATNGNSKIRVAKGAKVTIEVVNDPLDPEVAAGKLTEVIVEDGKISVRVANGANLELTDKDSGAKLKLGDGAVHPAIAEHLETMYALLKTYVEQIKVPTALGPSGPAIALSGPAPSWDPSIKSGKMSLPDG